MAQVNDPHGAATAFEDDKDKTARIQGLETEKATLDAAITELTQENSDLKEQVAALNARVTEFETNNTANETDEAESTNLVAEKETEILTLGGELETARQQIASLSLNVATSESRFKGAVALVAQRDAEIVALKAQIASADEALNTADEIVDAVVEQNELVAKHLQTKGAKPETQETEVVDPNVDASKAATATKVAQYEALRTKLRKTNNKEKAWEIKKEMRALYAEVEPAIRDLRDERDEDEKVAKQTAAVAEITADEQAIYDRYKAAKARQNDLNAKDRNRTNPNINKEKFEAKNELQRLLRDHREIIDKCQAVFGEG